MKCKNCGFPKDAHKETVEGDRTVWLCPTGAGGTFPATVDVKVELHYRAGDRSPWIAKCSSTDGVWEFAAAQPIEALEIAGREIEKSLEEKSAEEIEVEKAIEETRHHA
jgi:hypothetical protein